MISRIGIPSSDQSQSTTVQAVLNFVVLHLYNNISYLSATVQEQVRIYTTITRKQCPYMQVHITTSECIHEHQCMSLPTRCMWSGYIIIILLFYEFEKRAQALCTMYYRKFGKYIVQPQHKVDLKMFTRKQVLAGTRDRKRRGRTEIVNLLYCYRRRGTKITRTDDVVAKVFDRALTSFSRFAGKSDENCFIFIYFFL